jgi:hypothetical protein
MDTAASSFRRSRGWLVYLNLALRPSSLRTTLGGEARERGPVEGDVHLGTGNISHVLCAKRVDPRA